MKIEPGTKFYHLWRRFAPRKRNVCVTFSTPEGKATLSYLAKFCHAFSPTKGEREEGRRDVWLFLQKHLRLNEEEVTVMFAGLTPEQRHQVFNPGVTFVE